MISLYLYVTCCFFIYQGFCHHFDHREFIIDEGAYGVTTYRLLLDKYTRNDANDICRLYGGNIIRLDHIDKLVQISHINTREWQSELRHEYWIDLILDPVNRSLIWTSNCKVLDPSNDWTSFNDNFDMSSDKYCVTSKHGNFWDNKNCASDAMVLCETFQPGANCSFGPEVRFPILSLYGDTEAVCQMNCAAEPSCWSYTYSPTSTTAGTCVLSFDSSTQTNPALVMSTSAMKFCYNGELVGQINPSWTFDETNDDDVYPIYNCTAVTAAGSQQKQNNLTNSNLFNITNDQCATTTRVEYQTLTVIDTTTKDVMVLLTLSPTTVLMTTEIPTTLVMTTTEVPSPVVTTVVSTEIATTTLEIPTTIAMTTVVPGSNFTVTITPSIVSTTTVVSHDLITATAEVPTTVVITETPPVIVSTVAVTVATTSTVVIPTTVVSSEIETHATTVVVTTTVVATSWSSILPLPPAVLAEKLDNIVRNLTVPKKNTKAYQRSLVCADDDRQSAKTVGYLGIFLLILPLGLMICLDIPSAITRIRTFRKYSE